MSKMYTWQPNVVSMPGCSSSSTSTSPIHLISKMYNWPNLFGIPLNLTIARAERRSFRDSSGQMVTPRKETMCHYNCSLACIQTVMPNFHPNNLYISCDITETLDNNNILIKSS